MRTLLKLVALVVGGLALLYLWNSRTPKIVYSDEEEEAAVPNVPSDVGVRVGTITRGTVRRFITAYGTVAPAPTADARLSAPMASVVADVQCVEGQHITAGSILFTLDGRTLDVEIARDRGVVDADQAAFDHLSAAAATASPPWAIDLARQQRDVAQADLDAATARRKLLTVMAPIDGVIVNLNIHPGEIADPAQTALEIIDLDRLIVTVNFPAESVATISPGQTVIIDTPSDTADTAATQPSALPSQIVRVDPAVDPRSGMATADASIPAHANLKPGQFLQCQVVAEEHKDCLIVPAECIVRDSLGRARIGLVSNDRAQAALTPVEVGLREGDNVEISGDGIEEGQTVVTTGAYALLVHTHIHVLNY